LYQKAHSILGGCGTVCRAGEQRASPRGGVESYSAAEGKPARCFREKHARKQKLMRKLALGFFVVLIFCAGAYLLFHHRRGPEESAYVGSQQLTLWSSSAAVKEVVATANFGDRLQVVAREGGQAQVRTASGAVGWVDADGLLTEEFWQKAKDLLAETQDRPVEGRGQTRVIGNLHIDPARDSPRIRQLGKGVPVKLLERRAVAVPPPAITAPVAAPGADGEAAPSAAAVRQEDWWLVRAQPAGQGDVAGWLLGRFVALDVPAPLPDYATSAGVRIVAWFTLNRVLDEKSGPVPQYLVLGTHGPEGQPCDFTLLRAYTWDIPRQRYETAFVESDLCGKLPLQMTSGPSPGSDASFSFDDWSGGSAQRRSYRMVGTAVRRVRQENGSPPVRKRKR
jgi:hypothetical protein